MKIYRIAALSNDYYVVKEELSDRTCYYLADAKGNTKNQDGEPIGKLDDFEEKKMKIYKMASKITLYRGENAYNKGGHFWTTDKEWARQFTHSGMDFEIKKRTYSTDWIYTPDPLPYGGDDFSEAIEEAINKGYGAIWLSEGSGQPNSVFII